MNAPQHRAVAQIERDLQAIKTKLQMADPLPSIPILEAELQRETTKTLLDPTRKPDLHEANQRLQQAQQVWQERAKDNSTMQALQRELDEAIAARRIELARTADDALKEATAAYLHTGRQLIAAYRAMLIAHRRSAQTPGASQALPQGFHFGPAWPMGWNGQCSDYMLQGNLLPCEQADIDRQQIREAA